MTPVPAPPTLDFAGIRSRCPLAFERLNAWSESLLWRLQATLLHVDKFVFSVPDNLRDLFDFFDQQGVYVVVDTSEYKEGRIFYSRIASGRQIVWLSDGMNTRADAEVAGFEAAFGRLEEILNKEQG